MEMTNRLAGVLGGKDEAIRILGINPETWRLWMRDGIPASRWLFVEKKTGGAIRAEEFIAEARQTA